MLIKDILREKGDGCATVRPGESVSGAVMLLAAQRIGAVVVSESDRDGVVGIFSERDLVKLLARDGRAALDGRISSAMVAPVITCQPDDRIDQALAIMTERNIRHLPVVSGRAIEGMVSIRDLVRRRLSEKELEAAVLLDISRMHG